MFEDSFGIFYFGTPENQGMPDLSQNERLGVPSSIGFFYGFEDV